MLQQQSIRDHIMLKCAIVHFSRHRTSQILGSARAELQEARRLVIGRLVVKPPRPTLAPTPSSVLSNTRSDIHDGSLHSSNGFYAGLYSQTVNTVILRK